jgi:hypothetical protein
MAPRHTPKALSDYSVKYSQDITEYNLSDSIAPVKSVEEKTDQYYIYDPSDLFRVGHTVRANKTPAKPVDFSNLSTSTYVMKNHALKTFVSREDKETSDPSVDPEMDAVEEVTQQLMLDREYDCAQKFLTTTAITNYKTLTDKWSYDTTTSNPIADIDTATTVILRAIAKVPAGAVCGHQTMQTLKSHTEILDRIKWSERGVLTEEIIASILGLPKITVNKTIYNSAAEGLANTQSFLVNSMFLVYYNSTKPQRKNANLGTTFAGIYGGAAPEVKRYRDDSLDSDVIELNWMYDQKVVLSLSGYLLTNTD